MALQVKTIPRWPQYVVAAIYPVIMVLGKLASYSMDETYFSHKTNLLNLVVIRQGWLWTTVLFWLSYYLQPQTKSQNTFVQAFLRYSLATIWWYFFTQSFLGPPLMDRIFLWTGGQCVVATDGTASAVSTIVTSKVCRKTGGQWVGGHDPSGHFFMLVHSSLVLFNEILPQLYTHLHERTPLGWGVRLPLLLLAFWGWMLLMTSIYFHSFFEKFTGLIFGYVEVGVVYYLGGIYQFGRVLGVPETVEVKIPAEPEVEVQ